MATTKERLEQIENALLVLAGGTAGYGVARRGVAGTATAVARPVVATPAGRAVLAGITYDQLVQELNQRDREMAASGVGDSIFMEATRQLPNPIPVAPGLITSVVEGPAKRTRKKAKSKFNRVVSAGMKAVRNSKSYGKKGKINNAKRAFSAVTKVASKINRGKKVPAKGVSGTIARAVRKIL